jgi:hypothetical protein
VEGKLGRDGHLDGPGVAALLLGRHAGHAQLVVVLCLHLQETHHVLLRQQRHCPRLPVLPYPLPAGNPIAA